MKALLLPAAEQFGRLALVRRGILSRRIGTRYGRIHAYDAPGSGSLPPTVLLHGLGSTATFFGPLLEYLRRDVFRIVAPEYPGHGFSESGVERVTPEVLFGSVEATLDALVHEPAMLVGHSLGGAVALHLAIAHPERVSALVLVSPAAARGSDEEWGSIKRAFDVGTRAEGSAFLERVHHRPPWFLPLLAHEIPPTLRRRAVRDLLESASNRDLPNPDALGSLAMPILLLWGRSERLLPTTHLDYFAQHLPNHAVIERPEGFGHCPHLDSPGALAKRIVAFARASGIARVHAA